MKILIISHNVFDDTTSMGKTLYKFFETFPPEEIAQIYIHPEAPTLADFCTRYYRITDIDAMKSIFIRNKCGRSVKVKSRIYETDKKSKAIGYYIYQRGRSRSPMIYLARDFMWSLSAWKSKELKGWIDTFQPDIIFLASGDYAFIYIIAGELAQDYKVPLVIGCFDDFYQYDMNQKSFVGRIRQTLFMKTVRQTIEHSERIIAVCENMARSYSELFQKPCDVLYTSAEDEQLSLSKEASKIAYFGSIGLGRDRQLTEIGKVVKSCNIQGIPHCIDVYSAEGRPEILNRMTEENGIRFHTPVSSKEMKSIMEDCIAVIHTESFDHAITDRTKFSFSTKIAESLAYGPCLFAYGPRGIASIDYLIGHNAAIVATKHDELYGCLKRLTNEEQRVYILNNARAVARKNHNYKANGEKIGLILKAAIEEYFRRSNYADITD